MESGVTCERGGSNQCHSGSRWCQQRSRRRRRRRANGGLLILYLLRPSPPEAISQFHGSASSVLVATSSTLVPPVQGSTRSPLATGRHPAARHGQCHYFQSSAISGALRGAGWLSHIAGVGERVGESGRAGRGLREQFLLYQISFCVAPPMLQIPIVREGVVNQWGRRPSFASPIPATA